MTKAQPERNPQPNNRANPSVMSPAFLDSTVTARVWMDLVWCIRLLRHTLEGISQPGCGSTQATQLESSLISAIPAGQLLTNRQVPVPHQQLTLFHSPAPALHSLLESFQAWRHDSFHFFCILLLSFLTVLNSARLSSHILVVVTKVYQVHKSAAGRSVHKLAKCKSSTRGRNRNVGVGHHWDIEVSIWSLKPDLGQHAV